MQGLMWRCRASGCILVLNVAMHYNGSDRMHWFQGSASAVLMCGCSNPSPVCSSSTLQCECTAWLHDCLTAWLLQGNLANTSCHQPLHSLRRICGGGGTQCSGDSSENLCGDQSPLTLAQGAQTNGGHHFSCYVKNYFFCDKCGRYRTVIFQLFQC